MKIASILLAMALPLSGALVQEECSEECVAVLTAAAEWSLARPMVGKAAGRDLTRVTLDTGPRLVSGIAREISSDERNVLLAIAAKLGIAAQSKLDQEEWRACSEARSSAGCKAAEGRTFIRVSDVEFVSDDEAVVWSRIDILRAMPGFRDPLDYLLATELKLRRIDGTWQVVGTGIQVVS